MHFLNPFHKRFTKRAAAPVVPVGYTLSPVTVLQTVSNLRTTVIRTQVVTVAVPIKTTPAVVTPKPVVSTPAAPAVTPKTSAAVTPTPASPTPTPVVTPSSVSSSIPVLPSSSSPIVSSSPAVSPSVRASSSPAVDAASRATKSSASSSASSSVTAGAGSNLNSSSAASKGLSGGAIGGIVAGFVILALAILVLAVRRSFLRRRKQKRDTWGAGLYPKGEADLFERRAPSPALSAAIPPPPPEKQPMMQQHQQQQQFPQRHVFANAHQHQSSLQSSPLMAYQQLPPPQATYNNPPPPMARAAPVLAPLPPTLQPAASSPAVPLSQGPPPMTSPAGEHVRVVGEFDDGWALCENARGEQGVVPLECLDRQANPRAGQGPVQHQVQQQSQIQMSMSGRGTPVGGYNAYGNGVVGGGVGYGAAQQQGQQGYLGQGTGDWRMSRRASSLYAGVAAAMQQPTGGMHH